MNQQIVKAYRIRNIESVLPLIRKYHNAEFAEYIKAEKPQMIIEEFNVPSLYGEPALDKFDPINHMLYSVTDEEIRDELRKGEEGDSVDRNEINQAILDLLNNSRGEPKLTGGTDKEEYSGSRRSRNIAFGVTIKRLYGYKCAFCGSDLKTPYGRPEVQSAHIFPKYLDGKDDARNGICMCRLHHWAFDVGWIALTDNYEVILRDGLPSTDNYAALRCLSGTKLTLPEDLDFTPHAKYLKAHRELMGF